MSLNHPKRWATLGALVVVLLVVTNVILFESNRRLQIEVNSRSQYIQQTAQLEALQRELISAIANLSIRNKDQALGFILTQHGLSFTMNPPAGTSPPSEPQTAPEPKRQR